MSEYMRKTLEQIKAKYGDQIEVRILFYDSDEKLFKQYKVEFVPTQIFLDSTSELEKKLNQLKLLETP